MFSADEKKMNEGCSVELEPEGDQFSGLQSYKIIQIQSEDIEGLVKVTYQNTDIITEDEITIQDPNEVLDDVPCDEIAAETVVMTTSQFQNEISQEEALDLSANSFIQHNLDLGEDDDIESEVTTADTGLSAFPIYVTANTKPQLYKSTSGQTCDNLSTTETFIAVMPEEASSENCDSNSVSTLQEMRKRERDKVKKRELRQNNKVFRQKEREKARSRMKSKREDPEYREKERQRDRERRRLARQTNEEARQRERIRDREQKKAQRESFKEMKSPSSEKPIKTVTITESIAMENCFTSSMDSDVQDYWNNRHLIQAVNIHDGPIIQSESRTDDEEDECDSLLHLDFVSRLKSDPDTG